MKLAVLGGAIAGRALRAQGFIAELGAVDRLRLARDPGVSPEALPEANLPYKVLEATLPRMASGGCSESLMQGTSK